MVAKHSKTMRVLSVFTLIVFLFVFCISSTLTASALDWPQVIKYREDLYSVIFTDNTAITMIYADDVYIDPYTGNVYIIKPTSISNYKSYDFDIAFRRNGYPQQLVFDIRGQYNPVLSHIQNPDYDARYDPLLYKYCFLHRAVIGNSYVELIREGYSSADGGFPSWRKDLTISDANIEYLSYEGKRYCRMAWTPFIDNPEPYATAFITFTLRFEDIQEAMLGGYQTLRDIVLGVNSYITGCSLSLYHLQLINTDGQRFTLYFDDYIESENNTLDNFIDYLGDTFYGAGSVYEFSFEAVPANGDSFFDEDTELVLNVYDDGFVSFINDSYANNINLSLLNERASKGVHFQESELRYLEEKNNTVFAPSIEEIESVDDLLNSENDFGFLNNFLRWDSPILTNFVALSTISLCFATIGFALYGKKGG